jgi:hypothetical protein
MGRKLGVTRLFLGEQDGVPIRSLPVPVHIQVQVCFRHDAHRRTWPRRKRLSPRDNFVARQRHPIFCDRPQRTAPPVVDDERPFATRTVIQVSTRLEEAGKFVECLNCEQMRQPGWFRLSHWNCLASVAAPATRANQHRACQCENNDSTGPFAPLAAGAFQIASCYSVQCSSKSNVEIGQLTGFPEVSKKGTRAAKLHTWRNLKSNAQNETALVPTSSKTRAP